MERTGQGSSGGLILTGAATGVLSSPIALSVSGQPAGVSAGLSSNSLVPPGTATLNVTVGATAVPGSYPLVIAGVADQVMQKVTVTLVIGSATKPAFSFGVGTTALTVTHGTSGTLTVRCTATGAAAPSIVLSATGMPTGVTASFGPAALSGTGASTVTLSAAAGAKLGTATLTFAAIAGTNTQSCTVMLTVN